MNNALYTILCKDFNVLMPDKFDDFEIGDQSADEVDGDGQLI